jgi:hypothetical protein
MKFQTHLIRFVFVDISNSASDPYRSESNGEKMATYFNGDRLHLTSNEHLAVPALEFKIMDLELHISTLKHY